ncbi:hypothetical protein ACFX2C_031630 [Malus domestica]
MFCGITEKKKRRGEREREKESRRRIQGDSGGGRKKRNKQYLLLGRRENGEEALASRTESKNLPLGSKVRDHGAATRRNKTAPSGGLLSWRCRGDQKPRLPLAAQKYRRREPRCRCLAVHVVGGAKTRNKGCSCSRGHEVAASSRHLAA